MTHLVTRRPSIYHRLATRSPDQRLLRSLVEKIKDYLSDYYSLGKADLATAFVLRCRDFTALGGSCALVTPQNWLFLGTYKNLRRRLLETQSWNLVARLGARAFETISGEVVNVVLLELANTPAPDCPMSIPGHRTSVSGHRTSIPSHRISVPSHLMTGLDVSEAKTPREKAESLRAARSSVLPQSGQLENPDSQISFEALEKYELLSSYASVNYGSKPGQTNRVTRFFWELPFIDEKWVLMESTPDETGLYRSKNEIAMSLASIEKEGITEFGVRGADAWGKTGILLSQMRNLPCSVYLGNFFSNNTSAIVPNDKRWLAPIYAFMSSPEFHVGVRKRNQKLDVAAGMMAKVPFDLERWRKVAEERYPDGLPEPYSDDPTQWLFHGHPARAAEGTALHVGVARLLGYRWPAELDDGEAARMKLSGEGREWVSRSSALDPHTDPDEAGVLRSKFTMNWKKDRGKNPDGSERHNDLHLTRGRKRRRGVGGGEASECRAGVRRGGEARVFVAGRRRGDSSRSSGSPWRKPGCFGRLCSVTPGGVMRPEPSRRSSA